MAHMGIIQHTDVTMPTTRKKMARRARAHTGIIQQTDVAMPTTRRYHNKGIYILNSHGQFIIIFMHIVILILGDASIAIYWADHLNTSNACLV